MERNSSLALNSVFCIAPYSVLALALSIEISPHGGIRSTFATICLFLFAIAGIVSVIVGFVRWARLGKLQALPKLLKITACLGGAAALLLNLYFAFIAGLQLVGMVLSGYFLR